MVSLVELDKHATLGDQLQSNEDGTVALINLFTIDSADEEALIAAWSHDAEFMKKQPGYISTQLHKGIGGSSSYLNYAIWESVESFRNAFTNPQFQAHIAAYPESATVSPHLFKKLRVSNLCVE